MVVYPNRKQYNLRQSFVKTLPVKEDEKPDFLYYEHWSGSLTRAFSPNDKYVAWSVIPDINTPLDDYLFNYCDSPYGTYSDVMLLNLNTKTHIKLNFPDTKVTINGTSTGDYLKARYIVFSNDETKVAIFNNSCYRIDTFSLTDTTATHLATWYAPATCYCFDNDMTHVMRFGEYFMIHYDNVYGGLLRFDFDTLTPTNMIPNVIADMAVSSIREFEDGTIIAAGYKKIASVKTAYIRITDSNGSIMSEYYPNILAGQYNTGYVVAITKYGVIFRKLKSSDTMKFFSLLTQQTYTIDNGVLNSRAVPSICDALSPYYDSYIKFSDDEKSLVYCYGISGTVYYIIWHFNGSTYNITYSGTITAPYGSTLSTTAPSFTTPIRIDNNGHIIYYPVDTSTDITLYQYGEIMFDAIDNYHVDMPFPNYIADDATYTTRDNFRYAKNAWSLNKDFVIKSRRMLNPKKFLDIPGMVYNNDYPLKYNRNLSKLTPQTLSEHLGGPATNRLYIAIPEGLNAYRGRNPYMPVRNMLYSNTGKYGIYTQEFTPVDELGATMPIQIYNLDAINPDKEPEEKDDDEPKITTTITTTRHQINK